MRKSALYAFGLVVAALVALGLVVLFSASEVRGLRFYGDPLYFVKRQFIYIGIGIFVCVALAMFDYRRWRDQWILTVFFALAVFALICAALYALLLLGYSAIEGSEHDAKGKRRPD